MSAAPLERPTRAMPLRSPLAKPTPRRTPLRLVQPRRSTAAKAPFVILLVTLLVGGLLGLLLLNTLVAKQSFTQHDLTTKAKALELQQQILESQVEALQAPSALAAQATRLGMVPGGPPAFLHLPDGRVLGKPEAGVVPVVPKPVVTPAAGAAAPAGSTTWTAPKPGTSTAPTTKTKTTTKTPVKKTPTAKPSKAVHR